MDVDGLIKKFKRYPKIFESFITTYNFLKGKISGEEFFDKFFQPYFGLNFEIYNKIVSILTSEEFLNSKENEYFTILELENGEKVKVKINRELGFIVLNKGDVALQYHLKIEKIGENG